MCIDNLKAGDRFLGQTILGTFHSETTVTFEWVDGWTFTFPSGLTAEEAKDYYAQHAG